MMTKAKSNLLGITAFLLWFPLFSCKDDNGGNQNIKRVSIESLNLEYHVRVLAHDSLEGRGAGYSGEQKAASYISGEYEKLGLQPITAPSKVSRGFLQKFEFHTLGDSKAWNKAQSQNVVGILRGSERPDEYIVIGGHHDGQGLKHQADLGKMIPEIVTDSVRAAKDTIWNSAVDNAVSIASLLEIARVLKQSGRTPKRSIVFATFSAEESALDGATYFVNNPPVPIAKIKAMVNLEKIVGDPEALFLYVSYGTNPVFEKIRAHCDHVTNLEMNPFYPGMLANTDHYPFTIRQIPAVTIGTGSSLNVHTPLDHSDTLDYELLKERSAYIAEFLIALADSESTFDFTGDLSGLSGVAGGAATEREKRAKYFKGDVGFKITNVILGSKGHQAGLQPGDLVIAVNGNPLRKKPFYQGLEDALGLEELKASETQVTLELIRNLDRIYISMAI